MLNHVNLCVDAELGVAVRVAGVEAVEEGVVIAGAGIEGRGSQAREDLLRVLLGGDGDIDGEVAEGDRKSVV